MKVTNTSLTALKTIQHSMNTLWYISLIAGEKKKRKVILSTSTVQLKCVLKVSKKVLILKLCSSDVYTGDKEGSILTQVNRSVKVNTVTLTSD